MNATAEVSEVAMTASKERKKRKVIVDIAKHSAALAPIQTFQNRSATGTRRASFGALSGLPKRWGYHMSSAMSSTRRTAGGQMATIQIAVDGVWIRMRRTENGQR